MRWYTTRKTPSAIQVRKRFAFFPVVMKNNQPKKTTVWLESYFMVVDTRFQTKQHKLLFSTPHEDEADLERESYERRLKNGTYP